MDLNLITVSDFKTQFVRDFPFAPTNTADQLPTAAPEFVYNSDITRAFGEAKMLFNQTLFGDDDAIKLAYLYLTAHYMVIDLQTAQAGVTSQGGAFPVTSRRVGSVAESYSIPDAYKNNPSLQFYTKTGYGVKYLSFLLPRLVGNVGVVAGWTQPL